jgi:amino acid transporter
VLLVPATLAATVTLYNIGARIIATTAADGLLPARLSRVHPRLHTPYVAVGALAVVATLLTVLLQAILRKPPLLTSVYLANLTTYYWLAPYFLVCVGILRIIRRERARDVATVSAASLSMAAIVYVAIEMFRSPIDAGTTYLPYFAVASITAVALTFLVTRRDATASESEAERL